MCPTLAYKKKKNSNISIEWVLSASATEQCPSFICDVVCFGSVLELYSFLGLQRYTDASVNRNIFSRNTNIDIE